MGTFSMKPNRNIQERLHLLTANEQLIALSVARTKLDRDDLVVVVLDTQDPVARDLAKAIVNRLGNLDFEREETRILRQPDVVPTGIAVMPLAAARAGFELNHPRVADGLRAVPPQGRVRVVVVAAGGASLLHLPIVPLATEGSACPSARTRPPGSPPRRPRRT